MDLPSSVFILCLCDSSCVSLSLPLSSYQEPKLNGCFTQSTLATPGCLFSVDQRYFFNPSRSVFKSVNKSGDINLTSDEVKNNMYKTGFSEGILFSWITLWGIRCLQSIYSQKNINSIEKQPDAVMGKEIGCCWRLAIFFK